MVKYYQLKKIEDYDLIDDFNAVFSYINKYAENDFDLEYIKKWYQFVISFLLVIEFND